MALWYKTGIEDNMEPISLTREDLGLDVYLCASGPSLANVRDSDLHVNGALVAAVNNAYPHIKPDMWFGLDDFHCFDSTLWTQPFMKFVRKPYSGRTYHGIDIGYQHNTYYADIKAYPGDENNTVLYEHYNKEHEKIFYNREIDHSFMYRDSCRFATSILLYLGAKKIFLIGMDLDNSDSNYHDHNLTVKKGTEYLNSGTYTQVKDFYRWAAAVGKKHGVEFVSCTQKSPLNDFLNYMPIEDALNSTIKNRSYPRYNIINGRERHDERELEKKMKNENYDNNEDDYFSKEDPKDSLVEKGSLIIEDVKLDTPWGEPHLTLIDKMILFECDNVVLTDPSQWHSFWQELIDKGVVWNDELPRHYARTAAGMLRANVCQIKTQTPTPPKGWDADTFLQGPLHLGYDIWDRPPSNPNWGRPFRWKQIQKERVKIFKETMKQVKGGAKLDPRSCGGCKG